MVGNQIDNTSLTVAIESWTLFSAGQRWLVSVENVKEK